MNENKNLLLAMVLSAAVLFGWQYFVITPQMKAQEARQAAIAKEEKKPAAAAPGIPGAAGATQRLSRAEALKQSGDRIAIDTPTVDGSLRLTGGHFDDLRLKKYRQTVDPKSPEIVLLSPKATEYPFYVDIGWVGTQGVSVPTDATQWQKIGGDTLAPGKPIQLMWNNGKGLVFTRIIAVDDKYLFTVTDSVRNDSGAPVTLYPYAYVARNGVEAGQHYWVLHEGFVGVADNKLKDATYDTFKEAKTPPQTFSSTGGWVGITDKYWMAAVVPPQNEKFDGEYSATDLPSTKAYQASYKLGGRTIAPGASVSVGHRLFAGAKVVDTLNQYEKEQGIARFDLAVDWGWFIIITKPLFSLLDWLNRQLGNFGLAILGLTVIVKLLFFPLANTSFKSMSRMKKVQPEMERIKKAHADDPQKMQMEMMALYKREKVNPLMGCLPMLIQIPVFFSLYKVLIVTIEMYHAPFYGWIHDLSSPDPTSILNLFGLLPYAIPHWVPLFISIGIWPILMGITQWVQMKLNPAPPDPIQARMFTFMPIIFTFMFATFPVGLVIYYTWNNLLTLAEQSFIMKKEGVPIALFDSFKKKPKSS
jgi:YidC/Oxa1 family membrane protein insertase